MRRWFAAACLAALAAQAGTAVAEDRLCRAAAPATAEPQAGTVPGCAQAHCSAVGEQTLCSCQRGEQHRFERRRGTQVLQRWASEVSPMIGPGSFGVTQADVDGDGRPEWLVARLLNVSNGLGVSSHSLCVLWPDTARRAPVCREVSEWQALTVLVQEEGRPACSLMDAGWQSGREFGPGVGRGSGTYASGRLWRFSGGRWAAVPHAERSAVARRLLKDFEQERQTLPALNATRLWWLHPTAVQAACPGPLCPRLAR